MEHKFQALMMKPILVALLLTTLATVSIQESNTTVSNSNMTTTDSNLTTSAPTTKAPAVGAASTVTSKTTTASPPLGGLRPVSEGCLKLYLSCVENTIEYKAANFCQASTSQEACFNNTVNCTSDDVKRITYVDCGPKIFGADNKVKAVCQGRITECLSLSDKPENIKPDTDFKAFFCAKKDDKCLTTQNGNTVCTADEIKAAVKVAGCTAAHTVISSTLFISLALLMQWILYRD